MHNHERDFFCGVRHWMDIDAVNALMDKGKNEAVRRAGLRLSAAEGALNDADDTEDNRRERDARFSTWIPRGGVLSTKIADLKQRIELVYSVISDYNDSAKVNMTQFDDDPRPPEVTAEQLEAMSADQREARAARETVENVYFEFQGFAGGMHQSQTVKVCFTEPIYWLFVPHHDRMPCLSPRKHWRKLLGLSMKLSAKHRSNVSKRL